MKYLKVWTDFDKVIEKLSDAEKGRLFVAMLHYAETGEEPSEFAGNESFLWGVAKRDIDNAAKESKKNSINGSKGGRGNKSNESNEKQNEANESLKEKKRKEKKGNENKNNSFIPPTVDEVRQYCKERGNSIDPEYFVAYNENRDWKLSNGRKMKDWRLAVVTWEKNGFSGSRPSTKTVTAQQYGQRDYSSEDSEAMNNMIRLSRLVGGA